MSVSVKNVLKLLVIEMTLFTAACGTAPEAKKEHVVFTNDSPTGYADPGTHVNATFTGDLSQQAYAQQLVDLAWFNADKCNYPDPLIAQNIKDLQSDMAVEISTTTDCYQSDHTKIVVYVDPSCSFKSLALQITQFAGGTYYCGMHSGW